MREQAGPIRVLLWGLETGSKNMAPWVGIGNSQMLADGSRSNVFFLRSKESCFLVRGNDKVYVRETDERSKEGCVYPHSPDPP